MQAELRELLDKQAITELLYAYADGPMRTGSIAATASCWRGYSPKTASFTMVRTIIPRAY